MSSTITVDSTAIKRWSEKVKAGSGPETQKFLNLAMKNSANIVQRREMKAVSRGVTGKLARSIHQVVTELAAVIGPDHKLVPHYALDVEKGTKPHMPPVSSLQAWADAKGINPWALAMSIKKKGTMAHPFVKPTFDAAKPEVIAEFVVARKLIADFLAKA